jgi:hypothetical protein
MQVVIGYLLILAGLALIVVSALAWLGILHPPAAAALASATSWDVLLELVRKTPWPAVAGLVLIYAGLKMIQVKLPF